MYRCFLFWDSFIDFWRSDETDSMQDALYRYLDRLPRERILLTRDSHYKMADILNEYLQKNAG